MRVIVYILVVGVLYMNRKYLTYPVDAPCSKEHERHLRFYQLDKSTVAEYHRIKSLETEVLARKSGCMDWLFKGAGQIQLNPDTINREKVLKPWKYGIPLLVFKAL
jgi:hypothetical protein